MKKKFCYFLRVRYSECDAQKVVFNGRYVDYIDVAMNEFMRAIWGDYDGVLARGIDNQVVNLTINWRAPARFDEVIAIRIEPVQIGTTSYTLEIEFNNFDSGKSIASARITYVMVNSARHEKIEIPADMRRQLEIGAAEVIVDHAQVETRASGVG